MTRIASLDLLRGLAAFSVAIPHYLALTSARSEVSEAISVLSVEVFFVLSGFVLAPQILLCLRSGRSGDIGIFLVRRWMRTIPAYLFALVLFALISGDLFTADFLRYSFYVQNLFAQHGSEKLFPVAWSLSIEEWFYVTFPVLLLMFARWTRRTDDIFCLFAALCFIAAITIVRIGFGDLDIWGPGVRRVVAFRIDSIAYGFLFYLFLRCSVAVGEATKPKRPRIVAAFLLFAVATLLAFDGTSKIAASADHVSEQLFPFYAAGFGTSAIFLFHNLRGAFQKYWLVSRFCYFMGKISYSVYLFHLLIALFVRANFAAFSPSVQLAIYLGGCVSACTVFFYLFEQPILAARPRYEKARVPGLLAEAAEAEPAQTLAQ